MGFNLRNWLEESIADVNPFDNGATAQTVRAKRVQPAPAQTTNRPAPLTVRQAQPQAQLRVAQPARNNFSLGPQVSIPKVQMPKVQTFGQSSDPLKVGQVKTPQIQLQVQPTLQTPKLQPPQQSTLNPQQQVLSSQLQKQPVVNQRPLQVSQPQQPKLYSPVPVSGVSQSTWNAMTPQAQQAMITREKAQKQAQSDVWNPIKIGGDIVHAGGQAAKAAVDLGAGMINDLGNRTADFGEAGATVIGELNGQNKRNEEQIQRYIDEETRMRDSFVNRARNATSQAEFDKYINMARSLNAGISDNTDRLNALRYEGLKNTDPMKTISNAGMTALDLATLGKGKAILEGTKLSAKVTAPVIQQLMKNTAITGIQGFGIGGTYGGLSTMKDPNATAEDYMKNIGMGAMAGGALGVGAQVALPVAGVAAKQAVKGTESAIVRSANYGLKPPTNLSKDELYIASKVRQAREGYISPQDITVQEAAIYQNIQRKLGAKPGTPDGEMAVVDALGAHRDFETKRAVRKDATLNALEKSSDFTRQHLVPGGTLMGVKAKGFQDAQAKGLVFDGVDGKPRFEVDDSGAKILDDYFDERQLQDVLDHPKLYEQYPELRNMTIVEQPALKDRGARGMYDEANNALAVSPDLLRNPEKLKSTILHELQHAIQKKEDFARGGSLETFTGDETGSRYKEITKALKDLKPKTDAITSEINQALAVGDMNTVARLSDHPLIKRRGDLVREQNDIVINRQRPREAYNNLAGEAEARAVQARMDMPMSERYVKPEVDPATTPEKWQGLIADSRKFTNPDDFVKSKQMDYHGTNQSFKRFSPSAIGSRGEKGFTGNGFYFTNRKNYAREYGDNLIESHLNIKNPYVLDNATGGFGVPYSPDLIKERLKLPSDATPTDITNKLKELGHDGVVVNVIGSSGRKKNGFEKMVIDVEDIWSPETLKALHQKTRPRSTFYDSLDVPKEDLIIRNGDGKAMSIDDPTAALKQEARKYKSAEEFVKANTQVPMTGKATYVNGRNKDIAAGSIVKTTLGDGEYVVKSATPDGVFVIRKELVDAGIPEDQMPSPMRINPNEIVDAPVKVSGDVRTLKDKLADAGITSEKQLTDLYNQAHSGKAMSIEPKPKRTAKQVDAELKVMSDSPEFQEFYKGGKISGKSWNEYQRLSKEYRQLADAEAPKPTLQDAPAGKSTKIAPKLTADNSRPKTPSPFERDLQKAGLKPKDVKKPIDAKMLNDDEASQKAIGTQGLQNSKSGQRQSQGKRIRPTNQGTSSRSSQQSGQKNPLPDNKARTGRTYPDNTPDIDTAQYVKDMGRSQKSAMQSESGIKAKAADFKEKFIDDLSPIEDRLNKAIKDGASVDVKDHITYQLDRSRRAEGVMNAYVRDNGLDKIIQNVDNVDEFDQYLIARHAKELGPEITTGRDIAKDAALVRQLDGKYGEAAKELYKYNQKLLDTSVDYGLISKESAAALKKQYPDYVPFNRIFNEDELANLYGGAGKGDASLSSQNVVKKIKGSNRAIASPLNSIIDKTRVVVEQGERNRAAQMLANYRELPGNPYNLKEIPKNETIGTRHTISYLDKGVKRTFETDKVIADAAKNMTRQEIGLWGRIAAVPARVLRGGATTVNIGFAGANVVKDVIGAAINSKHPFRIADPKAFGKALSAALEHDGPYYQELMREGIAGTSFDMYRNPLKSNIGEIRSHKNLGTRAAYNVTHPSQWYRTLENTIGRSEDFGRALQYYSNKSGFEAKLGKGSKDAKTLAADQARHNSTNFFRHGSAGKGINLAIPYWNAGVQGARIQTRRIAERPVQTVAKIGFTIAAPSAMIAMNNYSTPERQEIMDNIQDYEKEGNIIILGANPRMNQETGKWEDVYKIPVPPQHIGIHTAVQDAVRSAKTGEEFDVLKNLGKITQNYTTVNPTNLRETASSYTPQALKLVAEPMTNTNFFTGNKIVPESQKNLPAKDQFGDYTSGTAKILGGITNISPRQIDNAIRTGTGGAGQNALWASDKMLAGTGAIEAKDVKGQDPLTSITRRFSGAASVSASDKAENLFKKYKEQVVQSNEYKNASQYDKQRMLNRLQNDLSAVEWDKTGKSEKNLTGKQKALKSDGFDPSVYTNLDSKTANKSTPKEKYDQTLKDYNDNKANMSEVQRFKKEKELATLRVKSDFPQDVVELWGMSKGDIYNLLTKDKDGNRKANELIKLDQAMYDAGLTKYLTFKNGIAPAQRGGTKRASTGRKGAGSRGGRARSAKGKFDYKLFGFSGSGGTSNSKQLHDLLKRAQLKVQK